MGELDYLNQSRRESESGFFSLSTEYEEPKAVSVQKDVMEASRQMTGLGVQEAIQDLHSVNKLRREVSRLIYTLEQIKNDKP